MKQLLLAVDRDILNSSLDRYRLAVHIETLVISIRNCHRAMLLQTEERTGAQYCDAMVYNALRMRKFAQAIISAARTMIAPIMLEAKLNLDKLRRTRRDGKPLPAREVAPSEDLYEDIREVYTLLTDVGRQTQEEHYQKPVVPRGLNYHHHLGRLYVARKFQYQEILLRQPLDLA